jgi:hypothetical protein
VWAPHPVHGFVLGTIIDLGNDTLTVRPAAAGGEPITATYDRVFPAIDETVKAVEDNCKLTTARVWPCDVSTLAAWVNLFSRRSDVSERSHSVEQHPRAL